MNALLNPMKVFMALTGLVIAGAFVAYASQGMNAMAGLMGTIGQ